MESTAPLVAAFVATLTWRIIVPAVLLVGVCLHVRAIPRWVAACSLTGSIILLLCGAPNVLAQPLLQPIYQAVPRAIHDLAFWSSLVSDAGWAALALGFCGLLGQCKTGASNSLAPARKPARV
jgi:hypothetical protein